MKFERKSATIISGAALVLVAAIGGGIAIGGGNDSPVAATTPVTTTANTTGASSSVPPSRSESTPAPVTPAAIETAAPVVQAVKHDQAGKAEATGELRLGMSEEEALATGLLTTRGSDDYLGCHTYSTTTFPDTERAVVISPTSGLARITHPSSYRTLEGIGVGSTAGDIRDTYVKASENRLGFTLFPSNESTGYFVFLLGGEGSPFLDTDVVQRVRTQLLGAECFLD
ncbi:hypothetical protein ACFFQW_24365 [Umezawaea endophytica]|uniref:Uncharacterized protein n=1 Tax=Umezawaea endophytica TaxID=1654476 RepID=A0A9X2VTR2_9PSEU|nr:hypothetical protein [Umezawaea endophytica]MCS7482157.1 hypothetical protein [Umezawaea endophytica]